MSIRHSLFLSRALPGIVLALSIGALSVTASAAAATPPLEERMTEAQFNSFGLDKLSPEQLRGLNQWLGAHVPTVVSPSGKPVFYPEESKRSTIEAQIVGSFTGWSGNTVFHLDNGQEWVQTEPGAYATRAMENAKVTIKPKMMGAWLLTVKGCGDCRIGVRRSK